MLGVISRPGYFDVKGSLTASLNKFCLEILAMHVLDLVYLE
jgi:hypothetical protein